MTYLIISAVVILIALITAVVLHIKQSRVKIYQKVIHGYWEMYHYGSFVTITNLKKKDIRAVHFIIENMKGEIFGMSESESYLIFDDKIVLRRSNDSEFNNPEFLFSKVKILIYHV